MQALPLDVDRHGGGDGRAATGGLPINNDRDEEEGGGDGTRRGREARPRWGEVRNEVRAITSTRFKQT